MRKKVLLVNPSIYDFSAYDFWLKPYGLLRVGGFLRTQAEIDLFDYLDRFNPVVSSAMKSDPWKRGPYHAEIMDKPNIFKHIPRNYRRFGMPRSHFQSFLMQQGPWDVVLIQTVMTYWYMGVKEVIEDIRTFVPQAKIVLGGVYSTLCYEHSLTLGADYVVCGTNLDLMGQYLDVELDYQQLPFWEGYTDPNVGVLKLITTRIASRIEMRKI